MKRAHRDSDLMTNDEYEDYMMSAEESIIVGLTADMTGDETEDVACDLAWSAKEKMNNLLTEK